MSGLPPAQDVVEQALAAASTCSTTSAAGGSPLIGRTPLGC